MASTILGSVITARLVRRGAEEREFDPRVLALDPPSRRRKLLWDMVLDAEVWQGGDGTHPRLAKTAVRRRRR